MLDIIKSQKTRAYLVFAAGALGALAAALEQLPAEATGIAVAGAVIGVVATYVTKADQL